MSVIRQPARVRRLDSQPKSDCGCSGEKSAHGPFGEQAVCKTNAGSCRVDVVKNREPLEFRTPDPMPRHIQSTLDYVVDWIYTKFINALNIARSSYYAMKSLLGVLRWGLVTYETYYNRRLYCITCEVYYVDPDNERVYCGHDPRGCGCPKFIDLFIKLRLAGFKCPRARFSTGRNIVPPELKGDVECQRPYGKAEQSGKRETSALQATGATAYPAPPTKL